MVAQPHRQRVSIEEYFEFLRAQPEGRYEYIDGVISPVAAAGGIHEYLCSNLGRLLGSEKVAVFSSDPGEFVRVGNDPDRLDLLLLHIQNQNGEGFFASTDD